MNAERTEQTKHTQCYLWPRYSIAVIQVMVATEQLSKWWFQYTTRNPWFRSFLVSTTLYQGNHD